MNLLRELAEARSSKGMSQSVLAEKIGVPRLAITRLEAGIGSIPTLLKAMSALEFRVSGVARGATLAAQISARRQRLGITVDAAAVKANLDPRTVLAIEAGRGSIVSLIALLNAVAPQAKRSSPPRSSWSYDQTGFGERDKRFTPEWFLQHVYEAFGEIDLDPCSHEQAFVQARRYIRLPECGLAADWRGARTAFVNPPFSAVVGWFERVMDAWESGEVETIIMLVPTRTDSPTFQERVARHADVLFLNGRMRFAAPEGLSWHAPFALMVVILGGSEQAIEHFIRLVPSVRMRPWGDRSHGRNRLPTRPKAA